jgi:hypothetical protein
VLGCKTLEVTVRDLGVDEKEGNMMGKILGM